MERGVIDALALGRSAAGYFLTTFAWSLTFWGLAAWLGGVDSSAGLLLFYVAGAGPLIAALVLVHGLDGAASGRRLWRSTFDPREAGLVWLLVALVAHPLIVAAAAAVEGGAGGEVRFDAPDGVAELLTLVSFVLIFGPLPEEMGWRGVALPRLQRTFAPLTATLLLACAWALWHLPLFFIEDTYQHDLGFGSRRFWIFMLALLPLSILISWVYNRSGGSVLSAVLIHFSGNLTGALVDKSERLAALEFVGLWLAAALILLVEGRNLGRSALAS